MNRFFLLVLFCTSAVVRAQVPQLISYQGRLLTGTNLVNGSIGLSLRVFKQAVGGSLIYEDSNSVAVVDGLYSTLIGDNTTTGTLDDLLTGGLDLYLEVMVNGVALAPREQLGSSLFALVSGNVLDGAITSAKIGAGAVTVGKLGTGAVTASTIASGAVTGPKIAAGSISNSHIAASTITSAKLVQGSGSGVDADMLDGRDFSAFLLRSGGSITGDLTVTGNTTFSNAVRVTAGGYIFPDGSTQMTAVSSAPGLLPWQVAGGTTLQAQANTGYIVTNTAQVVIALPASPPVGSIVRVIGLGSGGWFIVSNGTAFAAVTWTPRENVRQWRAVASSAAGAKLVAVAASGHIYTSPDSGTNWTERESVRNWTSVASSSNGVRLVAAVLNGQIYTSTDSGINWTPRDTNREWSCVASSADGNKLVAVVGSEGSTGQIYTSTNAGTNWVPRESGREWTSVASSADGTKLVAVLFNEAIANGIYTSTDSGTNWTPRGNGNQWKAVASSSDGTRLVAADGAGQLYTSVDSGANWVPRDSNRNWAAVASSSDGGRLVAADQGSGSGGQLYLSTNSGVTWAASDANREWSGVASSADGQKLIACAGTDFLYTVDLNQPAPLPAGSWLGAQNSAIELLHVGNNRFVQISHDGAVASN